MFLVIMQLNNILLFLQNKIMIFKSTEDLRDSFFGLERCLVINLHLSNEVMYQETLNVLSMFYLTHSQSYHLYFMTDKQEVMRSNFNLVKLLGKFKLNKVYKFRKSYVHQGKYFHKLKLVLFVNNNSV